MQAYTEILPSTAVTYAVRASLTSPRAQNLVIAKTSLLQIFDLQAVESYATTSLSTPPLPLSQDGTADNDHSSQSQTRLVLVAEYQLSGVITSLAPVKVLNTKAGGQALLVSSKDAKISLVEWNPELHGLSTISIHFYEGESSQSSPWVPDLAQCPSFLTVDPSSRCAALKFGQRHIALLPFRQAGDDLATEHYDPDIDGPSQATSTQVNGNGHAALPPTPYASSFVLSLTSLDPNLVHPIDLAFLHEYREPTLGVLSSSKSPSNVIDPDRKDYLSYNVFTLDLEQRARTPLLSVSGLPYDLFKVLALPLPVGGTLLLGGNEIIHVDQSGKTSAIAVNEFAKQCSSFPMVDHSDMTLKLEHCVAEQLSRSTGDMLIILNTGELCVLSFRVDGRSVSGLAIHRVSPARGGYLLSAPASCAVSLDQDMIFIGSEDTDSILVHCKRSRTFLSRKRSHAEMLGTENDLSDEEISDEDDLYGNTSSNAHQQSISMSQGELPHELAFVVHDKLSNLTPTGVPIFAQRKSVKLGDVDLSKESLELVVPVGRGNAGSLALLSRNLPLQNVCQLEIGTAVSDIWSIRTNAIKMEPVQHAPDGDSHGNDYADYDDYIITTNIDDSFESSSVLAIANQTLQPLYDTNFESDTRTLNAGVLNNGARVLQITSGEVRCYDPELGLAQIVPMFDESSDMELKILHTSFADPYLLVIRHDHSVAILKADDKGDVEEIDDNSNLRLAEWVCGCLHKPMSGPSNTYAYLLSADGTVRVYDLPNLKEPVYSFENLRSLPYLLNSEAATRRSPVREDVIEMMVFDLSDDAISSTYMLIRTHNDNIALYEAYHHPRLRTQQNFVDNLRWIKVHLDQTWQTQNESSQSSTKLMRKIKLGKYSAVLLPFTTQSILVKDAGSKPRLIQLKCTQDSAVSAISHSSCHKGLITVDGKGSAQTSQLPYDLELCHNGWAIQRLILEEEIQGVSYHATTGSFVVGTNHAVEFTLPEDDWHHEWANEDTSFKPLAQRGKLNLFDPVTRSVIHEIRLKQDECIMCMKSISLEISEKTHERKELVVVGTAIISGEDLPAAGSIYVFDIIRVVPEPDRPETDKALKIIVREETKGAVTAISDIGTEGFLIAAQGQKCMVRGLKEDNTLLPVAFMDMQTYVTSLKCVPETGLILMADALKGIWFAGFMNTPYALKLFGKSTLQLEVVAAEFLPDDKQLFLLAADADCTLHLLEYNPENPKSLSGQRLITRSTFHLGDYVQSMTLLSSVGSQNPDAEVDGDSPRDDNENDRKSSTQVLLSTQSGALGLITCLEEQTYRRLDALQTHLISILDHPCGLNPRAYRRVESEGFGARGIVDGQLLKRWTALNSQRKAEACNRVGAEAWEIGADLGLISGKNLDYFSS